MKKTLIAVIALSLATVGLAPAARADDRAVAGAILGAVIGYQLSRDRGPNHGHHGHRHYPPVSVVIGAPPPVYYPNPYPPPNYPYPYPEYVRPLVCYKVPVYDHWGNLTHYQQICRR